MKWLNKIIEAPIFAVLGITYWVYKILFALLCLFILICIIFAIIG